LEFLLTPGENIFDEILVSLSVIFDHSVFGSDSEYFLILNLSYALDINGPALFVVALIAVRVVFADVVHLVELEVLNKIK
jgi:hypothetical protein